MAGELPRATGLVIGGDGAFDVLVNGASAGNGAVWRTASPDGLAGGGALADRAGLRPLREAWVLGSRSSLRLRRRTPIGASSGYEHRLTYFPSFMPVELREQPEQAARVNDRSLSAELRVALRPYVSNPSAVSFRQVTAAEGKEDT